MKGTAALDKGVALLFEVAATDTRGANLTALVERSGLPRSTAFRLLESLVAQGMLQKDADRRYHLGSKLHDLGMLASHRYDLSGASFAPLQRLAERSGDTVFLNRRTGLDMVCVERIEGPNSVKSLTLSVGTRRPIGLGADGVALLAALEPDEAAAIMRANHARHVDYYGSSVAARLNHRVQIARRVGYAVSDGWLAKGTSGVGIGILPSALIPLLSLSIVSTKNRIAQVGAAAIAAELRQTAGEIADNIVAHSRKAPATASASTRAKLP